MSWRRKPILIGGLGVSGGLCLWWQLQAAAADSGEFLVWLAIAAGSGFWWLRQRARPLPVLAQPATPIARAEVEQAIATARTHLETLAAEAPQIDRQSYERALTALPGQLDRQADRIAIAGRRKVGKTSLRQALQAAEIAENLHWQEMPATLNAERDAASLVPALQADLVIFVIAGDLTESERRVLQDLHAARARVLIAFNKLDQYAPAEQVEVLHQVRQRLTSWLPAADIVAAAAAPAPLKVRQQQPDGSLPEHFEAQAIDVAALRDRLATLFATEHQTLAWATAWRAAQQLTDEIEQALQQARRDRALPIVERYQWIAAAAAFANPVAALDLLATAAVGAQMVVDLGAVYQRQFSLTQAEAVAGTLGALVAKLGLVELSTQAIAGVLKTNAVSYAAGGAVQGLSAAYLTRIAGLSLIDYFQTSDRLSSEVNPTRLEQALQTACQNNQRAAVWQNLVRAGLARWHGASGSVPAPGT